MTDGLVIGYGPGVHKRNRMIRLADGSFKWVDHDFDPDCLKDDDKQPATNDNTAQIADAILIERPLSLVGIYRDKTGLFIAAVAKGPHKTKDGKAITRATINSVVADRPRGATAVTFYSADPLDTHLKNHAKDNCRIVRVTLNGFQN